MSACRANATPAEARTAVPDGEVQIAPGSPKRGSLEIESVQPAMERVIATLPAQVLPDEGHTVRVASPVTGRIMTLDVSAAMRSGSTTSAGAGLCGKAAWMAFIPSL